MRTAGLGVSNLLMCLVWQKDHRTRPLIGFHGRTGDTAVFEGSPPYWRILGRTSVDIIKSGGYKISAPAIEDVLLSHDSIRECAVLGIPDETMGEAIAAVVAWEGDHVSRFAHRQYLAEEIAKAAQC